MGIPKAELHGDLDEKTLDPALPPLLTQDLLLLDKTSGRLSKTRLVVFALGQLVLWGAHV